MPFIYEEAPIVIKNKKSSDIFNNSDIKFLLGQKNNSPTPVSKFMSRYRNCTKPLKSCLAKNLIRFYEKERKNAPKTAFAKSYFESLPPGNKFCEDRDRSGTYKKLLKKAGSSSSESTQNACRKRKFPNNKRNSC